MHRIDESTYIDDSLVTCAEYQLFIDDVYSCRPDHWKTYRYTKGQALKPVLGMRHSDAVAFYKWVTLQEVDAWRYRLPTQMEAKEYPFKTSRNSPPLGYWAMSNKNQPRFVWAYPEPVNPREIDRDKLAHELTRNLARELVFNRNLDRALDLDYDINLARTFDSELSLNLTHTLNLVRDRTNHRDLDRALYLIGGVALGHTLNFLTEHIPATNFILDLFTDIYTLQERIAGRSPAFEGIRLVKERIR